MRIFLLFLFIIAGNQVKAQEKDLLLNKHWVLSNRETNFDDKERLYFVRQSLAPIYDVPLEYRYAGFTFREGGLFLQHFWNMCGNGEPMPDARGEFETMQRNDTSFIKIRNNIRWQGDYVILKITTERLVLKRN